MLLLIFLGELFFLIIPFEVRHIEICKRRTTVPLKYKIGFFLGSRFDTVLFQDNKILIKIL